MWRTLFIRRWTFRRSIWCCSGAAGAYVLTAASFTPHKGGKDAAVVQAEGTTTEDSRQTWYRASSLSDTSHTVNSERKTVERKAERTSPSAQPSSSSSSKTDLKESASSSTPSTDAEPTASASWWEAVAEDVEEDSTIETLLAGGVAGLVADLSMHPLDTISHRSKMHPKSLYGGFLGNPLKLIREEGLRGIFAGWQVTALVAAPMCACYFGGYHLAKNTFTDVASKFGLDESNSLMAAIILVSGAFAEFVSSFVFVPCEVIKSRLQLGKSPKRATGGMVGDEANYRGIADAVRGIVRKQGWHGLYAGWNSCILLDMCFSALQFLFYEMGRHRLESHNQAETQFYQTFWVAGCAGALSAVLTNPLDVITARLMAQGEYKAFGSGIVSALACAIKEGPSSLWRGAMPRMLSAFPYVGLQFAVFEYVRRKIYPLERTRVYQEWLAPARRNTSS
eukprot:gb/GECG01009432.1/.p1 GENE.gb/GECG01009432.1/~~gb/GECG01009432.1/.p1  ORF type:complete len:451 (+),score=52.01 gb/GECG01009432.1/:1-1353(+)